MEKFLPFKDFQQQLLTARGLGRRADSAPSSEAQRDDHPDVTPENLQEMHDYLAESYGKMDVVHSFLDDEGHYIDCIKMGTQPGLEREEPVATPPPFVTETGVTPRSVPDDTRQTATPRFDRFGNQMECPPGCIPVRRVTLDQIARAGTLKNYFKKGPGGGALPPSSENA